MAEQDAIRERLKITFPTRPRETSPDPVVYVPEEAEATQTLSVKRESSASPPPPGTITGSSAAPHNSGPAMALQVGVDTGLATPMASSARNSPDLVVTERSSRSTRSSSKRKASERVVTQKRQKTVGNNAARSKSNFTSRGTTRRMSGHDGDLGRVLCGESNSNDSTQPAAPSVRERQAKDVLRARTRNPGTPSTAASERMVPTDQEEATTTTRHPSTPVSWGGLTQHVPGRERTASPDPSLRSTRTSLRSKDISARARSAQQSTGRSNLRSASRLQVSSPKALLGYKASLLSLANPGPMAVRSPCSPDDTPITNPVLLSDPGSEVTEGPIDIQMEPPLPSQRSANQEGDLQVDMQETGTANLAEEVSQPSSATVPEDAQSRGPSISMDPDPDPNTNPSTPEPLGHTREKTLAASAHSPSSRLTGAPKALLNVCRNWGADWCSQLCNGGVKVNDKPSNHYAETLSKLSTLQPSVTSFLATLNDFQDHGAAQADVSGKRIHRAACGLYGTEGQPTDYVSVTVLSSWLKYLRAQQHPPTFSDTKLANDAAERDKETAPESLRVEEQQAQIVSSPSTGPEQDYGFRPDDDPEYPEMADINLDIASLRDIAPANDPELQPDSIVEDTDISEISEISEIDFGLSVPKQSRASRDGDRASQATEIFLKDVQAWGFGQPNTLGQASKEVPTHVADLAKLYSRQTKPQILAHQTSPVLSPTLVETQPSEPTLPTPLAKSLVEGRSDPCPALSSIRTPEADLPFPPGVMSEPPQCIKCVHSLFKDCDVYRDLSGFAQWKKICHFCRPICKLSRPSPCPCHRCFQLASGPENNAAPGLVSSSANQDDVQPKIGSKSGIREPTASPRLACSKCMQNDKSIQGLADHLFTVHKGSAGVICTDCNFERPSWGRSFQEHLSEVHSLGQRPIRCPAASCNRRQGTIRDLLDHYDKFHNGPYQCSCCGHTYTDEKALKAHIRKASQNKLQRQQFQI